MQYAVICSEEAPFEDRTVAQATVDAYPRLQFPLYTSPQLGPYIIDACASWPINPPPAYENEPVTIEQPVLVFSGRFDQIAPATWSQDVVTDWPSSELYIIPNQGHGVVMSNECTLSLARDFLANPQVELDDSCIENLPAMKFTNIEIIPQNMEQHDDVDSTPQVTDEMPAFLPDGWTEVEPGVYISSDGASSLTQQVIAAPDPAFVLPAVADQIGINEFSEGNQITSNTITWATYREEVDGIAFEIAVAGVDSQVYLVLLATPSDQRDVLYEGIFLPTVESFAPVE